MDRLTKRLEDGKAVFSGKYGDPPYMVVTNEALERLAAYEETGMTPEQIRNAQETLQCFDNIGIKRGNEIVKAEEEGRLVILPCRAKDEFESGMAMIGETAPEEGNHDPDGPGIPAYGMATKRRPKKAPTKGTKECRYNSGVLCDDWKCEGCGFNPERNGGQDGQN